MTNADWIRSLDNEELGDLLYNIDYDIVNRILYIGEEDAIHSRKELDDWLSMECQKPYKKTEVDEIFNDIPMSKFSVPTESQQHENKHWKLIGTMKKTFRKKIGVYECPNCGNRSGTLFVKNKDIYSICPFCKSMNKF
jgi:hypothetical protein